jgi:hypothetical protein
MFDNGIIPFSVQYHLPITPKIPFLIVQRANFVTYLLSFYGGSFCLYCYRENIDRPKLWWLILYTLRVALSIARETRNVALSLAKHIIVMFPCRLAYKSILWRASLATGQQDESPTNRRLALATTLHTKALQISHHAKHLFFILN